MGNSPSWQAAARRLTSGPTILRNSIHHRASSSERFKSGSRGRHLGKVFRAAANPLSGPEDWGIYNFKGVVAYRGTAYKGWQIQNGRSRVPTVQEKLQKALTLVKNEGPAVLRLQGAGRTDAGVHARGQVVNFFSHKLTPPPEKLVLGANSNLPDDIRLLSVQRVAPDFSARYSAVSKLYSFSIQTGRILDPFRVGLSQHVFRPLDVAAMRMAAEQMVGTHDFSQFSSMPSQPVWPVKRLTRVSVEAEAGGLRVLMDGSGFLYNQCRHMVGCLLQVGLGRLDPGRVGQLLQIGGSEPPGLKYRGWPLAAAAGLFLEEVRYPAHEDHTRLLHPTWPHDAHGRLWSEERVPQDEWLAMTGQRLEVPR